MHGDSSVTWHVGANSTATPNMQLISSGLYVSGAAVSSDNMLKPSTKNYKQIHNM